jgi:uncharacterized protein (DUF433 family)
MHRQALYSRLAVSRGAVAWPFAAGETREQILRAYPYLEPGDIDEVLRYAVSLVDDETIELIPRTIAG